MTAFCMWAEAFLVSVEVPALPVYGVYTECVHSVCTGVHRVCIIVCVHGVCTTVCTQ